MVSFPTSSTPLAALPSLGDTITGDINGRTIRLSAVAGNRWQIAEPVGSMMIGHGELVAVNNFYTVSTPSGVGVRSVAWSEVLGQHLDTVA